MSKSAIIPVSRVSVTVRPGAMGDLSFIDSLQKLHAKMVGWMPMQQLEGKIKAGHVIVAQDEANQPVGYCIGQDQYFKRDDVGIIYQMNVVPMKQRALIGATLVKAMFERAAYGCRLFCCWCAQDIDANHFWKSLGFFPLAFRSGSRGKGRTHIFWQRRIREGDVSTPFWFPAQTSGGSIREDRLVLPIPPGTSWRDVMPVLLPSSPVALPEPEPRKPRAARKREVVRPKIRKLGGVRVASAETVKPEPVKPKREKKPKSKNDPRHVAAARELRDRYLERFNSGQLLPEGKYAVGKLGQCPHPDRLPEYRAREKLLEAA